MLSIGASTNDCIGEEIDNSLDAGANRIRIYIGSIESFEIIIADNGIGMNKQTLRHAYQLNNRSDATDGHQGTFGFGNNLSKAHLTQLRSVVYTVSKMSNMQKPIQIEIDFPDILSSDSYQLATTYTDTNSAKELIYKNYIENVFESQSGTVHVIPCAREIFMEILQSIESKNIIDSLIYRFGVKYNEYIKNGATIEFVVESKIYRVDAVDPLQINDIEDKFKRTSHVEIYHDTATNDLLTLIKDRGYLINGKGRKLILKTDPLPPICVKIAEFVHQSAYSVDWSLKQKELFEEAKFNPVVYVNAKGKKCKVQKTVEYMGGRYYNRNLKNIDRVSIVQPSSGDKARYKFVTNSRHRLCFPVAMDTLMGIQVNKSALKEDLIHPAIKQVRDFLEKEFADNLYDEYNKSIPGGNLQKVTKQDALNMVDKLIEQYNSYSLSVDIESLIYVLLETTGKHHELFRFQWNVVANNTNGVGIILDVLRRTFDTYKEDESNVQGGTALMELFET
jgi:hypothetical protein